MSPRRQARHQLDAEAVPPECVCTAQQIEQKKALADIRDMAIRACGKAGADKQLMDFALDVINRTRGL